MKPISPLNREQLAHVLGIAAATVTKLEAEGLPRAGGDDRRPQYDIRAAVQWYLARELEAAKRPADRLEEVQQRARYYQQRADSLAAENARKAGRLVDPDVIETVLGQVVGELVAALDALPAQIKRDIPHLRAGEIDSMRQRIARTRNRLARIDVGEVVAG